MAEQIGTLLWELRTARKWSLGQLSERAGVSKASLSRWEAGERVPRVPELEATLNALEASPAQRSLALARIAAPRALRLLREPSVSARIGPQPAAHHLLRAMRLRGGWTQEQIALRIGVRQHTIARWEAGERIPSNDELQQLCFAMKAKEQELIALTTGHFTAPPEEILVEEEAVEATLKTLLYTSRTLLEDLNFLALERALWKQAVKHKNAQRLLALTCAYHAHYLGNQKRWQEAQNVATRTLDLTSRQEIEPDFVLRAVLKLAASAVYSRNRPAPERGIHLLQSYQSRSTLPDYTGWILSDMAKYAALAGQTERGVALAHEAVQVTEKETEMRNIDYSHLLNANGQPNQALRHLPDISEKARGVFVYTQLVRTEAYLGVGDPDAAQNELWRAYTVIKEHDLKLHLPQADALARQLSMDLSGARK